MSTMETEDARRAKRVIECVDIFRTGCSNASADSPTACATCTKAFLEQIEKALKS